MHPFLPLLRQFFSSTVNHMFNHAMNILLRQTFTNAIGLMFPIIFVSVFVFIFSIFLFYDLIKYVFNLIIESITFIIVSVLYGVVSLCSGLFTLINNLISKLCSSLFKVNSNQPSNMLVCSFLHKLEDILNFMRAIVYEILIFYAKAINLLTENANYFLVFIHSSFYTTYLMYIFIFFILFLTILIFQELINCTKRSLNKNFHSFDCQKIEQKIDETKEGT